MAATTRRSCRTGETPLVGALRIAIVSNDPDTRMAAARAFDGAPPDWVVQMGDDPAADVTIYGTDLQRNSGLIFDPERPGSLIDEIRREKDKVQRRTIGVTGTGGGVGTTSVALHLGAFMSTHRRTCVVDCDVRWGGAFRRVGLEPPPAVTIDPTSSHLRALPCAGGFRVLAHDLEESGLLPTDPTEHFERVLFDLGARVAPEECDSIVMVMPPTVHGAKRARELLNRIDGLPSALVSNRTGPGSELTVGKLESMVGRSVSVELPVCATLRDAEDRDRLLTSPWTRWARRVKLLAAALDGCPSR